jgi:diguanylate cyclase (GGDEF)-like protein
MTTTISGVGPSVGALAGARAAHRMFAEHACDLALSLDERGRVDFVTENSCRLLCVEPQELLGKEPEDLFCGDAVTAAMSALERAASGPAQDFDVQIRTGLGECLPLRIRAFRDIATKRVWLCGQDLSSSIKAEAELRRLATHDVLTGLPNRTLLRERVEWHIKDSNRQRTRFAVAMMDLDGFKKVNDALGHLAGDSLLKVVGARLRDALRDVDTVSRTGGDEFMLVLGELKDPSAVATVCDRVLNIVRKPVTVADQEVYVSTSVGVAIYPDHGQSVDELTQHADMAMYQAKQQGKNRFSVYSPELLPSSSQVSIEASMFAAISQGEFLVHFQPLVDAKGNLKGCEALMRWVRPDGTTVSPAEFIPVAENNGLINVLGDYALRAAAMQLVRFDEQGLPGLYMSVNVSPRQLRHPDFEKNLKRVLALTGIEPSRIVLEITESFLMNEQQKTQALLRKISDIGVRFSLDDFGTGYSCLAYLKTYPISNLKIDRSFIQELDKDDVSCSIVKAIIELAKALGLKTVVEGVETESQASVLRGLGVDYFQGYLFGRPTTPDVVVDKFLTK